MFASASKGFGSESKRGVVRVVSVSRSVMAPIEGADDAMGEAVPVSGDVDVESSTIEPTSSDEDGPVPGVSPSRTFAAGFIGRVTGTVSSAMKSSGTRTMAFLAAKRTCFFDELGVDDREEGLVSDVGDTGISSPSMLKRTLFLRGVDRSDMAVLLVLLSTEKSGVESRSRLL